MGERRLTARFIKEYAVPVPPHLSWGDGVSCLPASLSACTYVLVRSSQCRNPLRPLRRFSPARYSAKRYRIEEVIGSGGYACVYRATDMDFGYERAVKEVLDTDPGVRKQFRFEAELLINTQLPNIPHGYAVVEDRGRMFLVMEFVRGKDLEELLNDSLVHKGRPLDEASALRWMIDICGAFARTAHASSSHYSP